MRNAREVTVIYGLSSHDVMSLSVGASIAPHAQPPFASAVQIKTQQKESTHTTAQQVFVIILIVFLVVILLSC